LPALGGLSAALVVGVAWLPSDRFPRLHGAVALSGAALAMGCCFASVRARRSGEARRSVRRTLGTLALSLSAANAALYAHVAYFGGSEDWLVSATQKLASATVVAWMLSTLRAPVAGELRSRG
jgi:hypothetical protein